MTYYKTGGHECLIEKIEVSSETEKFICIKKQNGRVERCLKLSVFNSYFKTFNEAKEYLKNKAESSIKNLENSLLAKKERYEKIIQLTE